MSGLREAAESLLQQGKLDAVCPICGAYMTGNRTNPLSARGLRIHLAKHHSGEEGSYVVCCTDCRQEFKASVPLQRAHCLCCKAVTSSVGSAESRRQAVQTQLEEGSTPTELFAEADTDHFHRIKMTSWSMFFLEVQEGVGGRPEAAPADLPSLEPPRKARRGPGGRPLTTSRYWYPPRFTERHNAASCWLQGAVSESSSGPAAAGGVMMPLAVMVSLLATTNPSKALVALLMKRRRVNQTPTRARGVTRRASARDEAIPMRAEQPGGITQLKHLVDEVHASNLSKCCPPVRQHSEKQTMPDKKSTSVKRRPVQKRLARKPKPRRGEKRGNSCAGGWWVAGEETANATEGRKKANDRPFGMPPRGCDGSPRDERRADPSIDRLRDCNNCGGIELSPQTDDSMTAPESAVSKVHSGVGRTR